MSKTVALLPVACALNIALDYVKNQDYFVASGDNDKSVALQKLYLDKYHRSFLEAIPLFSVAELRAMASSSVKEINRFLKENGFDISLEPFSDPSDFGTASIMDVVAKWCVEGKSEHISFEKENKAYFGALVEGGVTALLSSCHPHPIAHIKCKNNDDFFITIADCERESFDLLSYAHEITTKNTVSAEFDAVHYPMVDHKAEVDISFFKEMSFLGTNPTTNQKGNYKIKEAKQQTIFLLNESGVKAKSAAAFAAVMECCMVRTPCKPIVINKPFFVILRRPGMLFPYFAGYITVEDFKPPTAF